MLFNNLIFSPLEGHKLVLRGGFWKIKSPSSVCVKFKQILNDKPLGFGPLCDLCVVSLALLPMPYV